MSRRLTYSAFLLALTALSLLFVWPIYQDSYLLVTALVSLAVGAIIGALKATRSTSTISVLLSVLIAYVVLALPLANPRALANPATLLSGWVEAVIGPVQSWKQIITIDLPIGTYHALLSPILVLFLLSGLLFGWLLFTKTSRYWLAMIPVLALVIFAIAFGLTTVAGDFSILGFGIPVETPLVSGGALFVLLVVYLNWGAKATRRETLMVRQESLGVTSNLLVRKLRRSAMAIAVVGLAVVVTISSMQLVGVSSNRVVLRTGVEKLKVLQQQTSPLSTYRMYFTNQNLFGTNLLRYSADPELERIRIATMPYFDGEAFTVAPTVSGAIDDNVLFSRLPSELPGSGSGETKSVTISLGELNSIWLPTVSGLRRITFEGDSSTSLSDALFVNRITGTAAIIPGDSNGATYRVSYQVRDEASPASIQPSSSSIDEELIPESLKTWLAAQPDISVNDGNGLLAIAKRLRDRGFLSHGLIEPGESEAGATNWVQAVDGLRFQKSTAGHNLARIDQLFKDLNGQQERLGNRGNLVATAGDDEQFATAIALIAAAKNFPARVVVGFRTPAAPDVPGVSPCDENGAEGNCTGANLTAWTEVQGANGDWLAIDATPQFEQAMNVTIPPPGLPKNPTDGGEDTAGVLPPGKSVPSVNPICLEDPSKCLEKEIPWWVTAWEFVVNYVWPALQLLLILSIFIGPFALILIMKRRRRKTRRNHPSVFARIVGAWEEFVDLSVDYGAPMPRTKTRLELARESGNPDILRLAVLANEMAYGSSEFESIDVDLNQIDQLASESWKIFDAEHNRLKAETKNFKQFRASLSLRSFIRVLQPKEQLKKLSSSLRFSTDGHVSDGSGLAGLVAVLQRQVRERLAKK